MRIICAPESGASLLPALIEACADEGYRQMIAYVDSENGASLSLHEACGFRRVAYLEASASASADGPTAS